MADIVYIEQGYYEGDNYFTYTADASATLNASAQILCDVTTIKQSVIDITSAFTPTLTASALKNHTAVLDAQFDITATASRTVSNQSTLDNIVTLSLQGDRQAVLAATTLSSEFTQSTQINATKSFNSTFNPAFSINADGDIVAAAVEAAAVLNTEFAQQVTGAIIKNASVATQLEFAHSTQADRIRGISTDILIAFQSANVITGFLQNAQVSITDAFTPTITASALKNHTAVLDSVCTVSCVITKTADFTAVFATEIVQTTQVSVTKSTDTQMVSAFTQLSTVSKTVAVFSDHNIQFNTQITVGKVVPFTDTVTITVTNIGLIFYIDGVAQPTLTLLEGNTYIFNYPSSHPLAFSTTANGTHSGGTEYTTGITRDSVNNKLIFVVGYNTPTLYYYCQVHSGMGGTALTPRPTVDITSTASATSLIWKSKWYGTPRPITWIKTASALFAANRLQLLSSQELAYSDSQKTGSNNWFTIGTNDFTLEFVMLITNVNNLPTQGNASSNTIPFVVAVNPNISGFNYSSNTSYQNFSDFNFGFSRSQFTIGYDKTLQKITAYFGSTEIGTSFTPTNNDWFYVCLGRQNGQIKLTLNNTTTNGFSYVGDGSIGNFRSLLLINSRLSPTSGKDVYFDSVQFKIGEYAPSFNTSLADAVGTENTKVIGNFNGNLDDTLTSQLIAVSSITATATVTASAAKSASASAQLNSAHTLTAIIGEVLEGAATLNAEFTHTTSGTRIKQFDCVITAEFTHTTVAERTLPGSATITAQHTLTLTITRIFVLQSNFESIATQLTSVARVGAGLILAETFVTQSTTAVKTAVAQADMQVSSVLVLAANRFRLTTADTQIEFTLNALNSRIRALNSNQNTEFAFTAATDRIRSTDSTFSSEFAILCEPLPIKRAISNQSAEFTQSTITDRTRSTTAAFSTEFTQQSTGIIAVDAAAALSTQSQINCEVNRIRPGVVIMDAIAVNVTAAAKTGTGLVTIESQSQCTVTAQKTTDIQLNVVSTAELTSIIERIQQGVASINSTFTQIANGVLSTDVVANLNTEFNHTVTAQKTVSVITNIQSEGGFVMAVVAIRNGEIIIIAQSNITTTADRRRNTGADLNNSFTLTTLAGLQASASSVQNCTVTIAVTAGVLRLDDIILYVKTEARSYSINNEQRSYAIREENRLYTIEE